MAGRSRGGGELIGVGDAAAILGISTARVRQLRLEKRFPREAGTISGRRLYRRADIEAFARQREKARRQ